MTTARDGLRLRWADRADDEQLRALNATAFAANPKVRPEITAWQWWDNPFGDTLVAVWDEDGAVVAQYVAYCVRGRVEGRPVTFTIGVDAAVDPRHQGSRLFTPLSEALYERATARGTPLVAYPNERSVRGIARAGWKEVAQLRVRVRPLRDEWLASKAHLPVALSAAARHTLTRRPHRRDHEVDVADELPDGIDDLWARTEHHHRSGIVRDEAWWRWRYAHHPDRPYRYVVARRGGRTRAVAAVRTRDDLGGSLHCLLELMADDGRAAWAVVDAIAHLLLGPADAIALTAMPRSRLDRLAASAGMLAPPQRVLERPIHYGLVPHPTLVPDPAAVRWSTSWGDLDHI